MTQNVFITGTSSGFGQLIAKNFLENGYTVFASMRQPEGKNTEKAKALQEFAEGRSGKVYIADVDVTKPDQIKKAVDNAIDQEGSIDVLVNNAGIGTGGVSEAFTEEQFRFVFDVNLFGVQRMMKAVLPYMRKQGEGLVVNISSIMGRFVIPFSAPYTAAKYALEALSESYKYELSQLGIDVAIVEPGGFATNFADNIMFAEEEGTTKEYGSIAEIPEKMWGDFMEQLQSENGPDPDDVAKAVLKLAKQNTGERDLRTVVDPATGGTIPEEINKTNREMQKQFMQNMQLDELLQTKVPRT